MRATCLLLLLVAPAAAGPQEWLVIGSTDRRGRRPFNPDAVFARYLLDPRAAPPREGDSVKGETWKAVRADEKGNVKGKIRYAYAAHESDRDRIVLATLRRGGTLFVNGDAFVGDVYGGSYPGVAVPLRKGRNHLFVRGVRGSFRLTLEEIEPGVIVSDPDATLPDRVEGESGILLGSVAVLNASHRSASGLVPFGARRRIVRLSGKAFNLKVRKPGEVHRRTFRSSIDGSIQQYSVRPPGDAGADGLVLTLHGAGVDAFNQARSYSTKPGLWIVAATNRRPFGFDWQDWGRADAYEVLADMMRWTPIDPDRIYLTGHSMGGHGTWHLAANDPDRWAAIAPSAGWSSFDSYGGRPGGRFNDFWRAADAASETLRLLPNLVSIPTFILHGAKDDNVPIKEARLMEKALRDAGAAPVTHYQEGAGHWWNGKAAKGTDCVDWPGIFALFENSRRPKDPTSMDFVSAGPEIDADHHWIHLEQPFVHGERMRIRAKRADGRVEVTTENVRRFRGPPGAYVINGTRLEGEWFLRGEKGWTSAPPVAGEKSPARSGPFKRAFYNRFVFVYGDAISMKRARYDAQVWWYRANGDVAVLSDAEFLAGDFAGRNVILYGNATTNRAWKAVFAPSCPLAVENGSLTVGGKTWNGDGLACLFVYPRKGDPTALAAAFAHTGEKGARVGYTLLPFISGVGYPDFVAFTSEVLTRGDEAVLSVGWFRNDWSLPGR